MGNISNADYPFLGFDNYVLLNKIESILSTKMDMNRWMTADYSLVGVDGMVKKIHRYTPSNANAETLERGDGSTVFVDASYVEEEYRVKRDQLAAKWYDDDAMTDSVLIETKVNGVAEGMVNAWTARAIAEFNKTTNHSVCTNYALMDWANAINVYAGEFESQEGLFFLAPYDMKPQIEKILGDDLKYVTNYIERGTVATVMGIPVYFSKALPKGIIFLADNKAVTAFMKKDVFVEQDRDKSKKENFMYASRYSVIALVDEKRCVKLGKAQATPATITTYTAGAKTIAGAATTGAKVTAYVNGNKTGAAVVAAANAYSITADENLVAGDKVKIVAEKEGFLPEYIEVIVA